GRISFRVWIKGSTAISRGGISRHWPESEAITARQNDSGVRCSPNAPMTGRLALSSGSEGREINHGSNADRTRIGLVRRRVPAVNDGGRALIDSPKAGGVLNHETDEIHEKKRREASGGSPKLAQNQEREFIPETFSFFLSATRKSAGPISCLSSIS